MKELHIHEILRMMIETQKTYKDKADFVKDIKEKLGADVRFHACSDSNMDAELAFDFLVRKGKIGINNEKTVGLEPDMHMCDDDKPHEHD